MSQAEQVQQEQPSASNEKKKESKYQKKIKKLKRKFRMFKEVISFGVTLIVILFCLSLMQNPGKYNNQQTILVTIKSDANGYAIYDSDGKGYWVDEDSYNAIEINTHVLIHETQSGWRVEKPKNNQLRKIFERK